MSFQYGNMPNVRARLNLYMPRQAGRVVRPNEETVVEICGSDPVLAQDELKIWQLGHKDTSDQMPLGDGMIGIKVYYSAREDPEQRVIKDNFHKRAELRRRRDSERRFQL